MKKNLMSILILALLVVNIALTAVMMFSVTGAMKSTTALVGRVAAVLNLELDLEPGEGEKEVPISDLAPYDIAEAMTISLKPGMVVKPDGTTAQDTTQHYAQIAVSLQLDTTSKDYKEYSGTLATNESVIKAEIISVISSHTLEEFQSDTDGIRSEILERLRRMYDSDFIYKVVFSDVKAY